MLNHDRGVGGKRGDPRLILGGLGSEWGPLKGLLPHKALISFAVLVCAAGNDDCW